MKIVYSLLGFSRLLNTYHQVMAKEEKKVQQKIDKLIDETYLGQVLDVAKQCVNLIQEKRKNQQHINQIESLVEQIEVTYLNYKAKADELNR